MATILFVSEACLLDRKSGAARSVLAILQALAGAGHDCHAATMSIFDGDAEYPRPAELDDGCAAGDVQEFVAGGIHQRVYRTASSRIGHARPWEVSGYQQFALREIRRLKPDLVLTYCSEALEPVLSVAQLHGARTVFYVGTAAYADRPDREFRHIDNFVMPSQALVDLYRDKRGIAGSVVKNIVELPSAPRPAQSISSRRERFVTMVNPEPVKGGAFFLHLVAEAKIVLPDVRFQAVEGRWGKAQWQKSGVDTASLSNLSWHPTTDEMQQVYDQSALLLMPSLNFEGSGRVILEAMHAGLPVLAMDMGGIAEQLDNGGFLFDCPQDMRDDLGVRLNAPEVRKWLHFIAVLMRDDAFYQQASDLAAAAARRSAPEPRQKAAAALFDEWLATPPGLGANMSKASLEEVAKLRARMTNAIAHAEQIVGLGLRSDGALGAESEAPPYAEAMLISMSQPALREALRLAEAGEAEKASAILASYLRVMPQDCFALRLFGELAARQGRFLEAGAILQRAADLAPDLLDARDSLIAHKIQFGDYDGAVADSFELIAKYPGQHDLLGQHGQILALSYRFDEAASVFAAHFRQSRGTSAQWVSYGELLRALGKSEEAVHACATAAVRDPSNGVAWYRLAEVSQGRLDADQAAQLQAHCNRDQAGPGKSYCEFALAMLHEAQGDFEGAFAHFDAANRLLAAGRPYDPTQVETYVADAKQVFTGRREANAGHPSDAPIFVVGLHRSGTTLVEQMLASHSQIEGTRELPFLPRIAGYFGCFDLQAEVATSLNAALLDGLEESEVVGLGQSYLDSAATARRTDLPHFTDKLPSNWMHIGLITRLFSNAKIIDVRRHPMATGVAQFRKPLGTGTGHAQNQVDFARYYRAYSDFMAHFDAIAPRRVHHVQYEHLVADPRGEVERMLDYCGLDFEADCLEYWKADRPVVTPSAEQVRQPLTRAGIDHWTKFRPWFGEMEAALGDAA